MSLSPTQLDRAGLNPAAVDRAAGATSQGGAFLRSWLAARAPSLDTAQATRAGASDPDARRAPQPQEPLVPDPEDTVELSAPALLGAATDGAPTPDAKQLKQVGPATFVVPPQTVRGLLEWMFTAKLGRVVHIVTDPPAPSRDTDRREESDRTGAQSDRDEAAGDARVRGPADVGEAITRDAPAEPDEDPERTPSDPQGHAALLGRSIDEAKGSRPVEAGDPHSSAASGPLGALGLDAGASRAAPALPTAAHIDLRA